jgi:hypothetical protein
MNKEKKDIVSGSNLKFYLHADETGLLTQIAGGGEFFFTI